jgi:hypothetical protein
VHALVRATRVHATNAALRDAETRQFASAALASVCETVGACREGAAAGSDSFVAFEFSAVDPALAAPVASSASVAVAAAVEAEAEVEFDIDASGNMVERVIAKPASAAAAAAATPSDWNEFARHSDLSSASTVSSSAALSSSAPPSLVELVCGVCLRSLRDYSTDKRGDVGSWVREAAMKALQALVLGLTRCGMGQAESERVKIIGTICEWFLNVCVLRFPFMMI